MGHGETLLERLRRARNPQSAIEGGDRARLEASVARNIQRILSARQGHAPAQMEYGVPAPSEVVNLNKNGLEMMQGLLKTAVTNYEPRLADVQVLQVFLGDDEEQLVFSIRGRLHTLTDRPVVSFDAYISPSGRLLLKV